MLRIKEINKDGVPNGMRPSGLAPLATTDDNLNDAAGMDTLGGMSSPSAAQVAQAQAKFGINAVKVEAPHSAGHHH